MRLPAAHRALELDDAATPEPGPREVLLEVTACGMCRTDLHIVDSELEGVLVPWPGSTVQRPLAIS